MYGAILGDIIGSPYEFDRGNKSKEFPLFSRYSEFTDDTVMTIAVADAFLECLAGKGKCRISDLDEDELKAKLVEKMQDYGRRYPYAGYGGNFAYWLEDENPEPYNSFGNGSAMRVSSVAWLFDDIISVINAARISAEASKVLRLLPPRFSSHEPEPAKRKSNPLSRVSLVMILAAPVMRFAPLIVM